MISYHFSLKTSDVEATGKVGLSLQTNFSSNINYDVSYQSNGSYFTVRHTLTLRLLMSYIYGAPILDVSRSHTTTHHSR